MNIYLLERLPPPPPSQPFYILGPPIGGKFFTLRGIRVTGSGGIWIKDNSRPQQGQRYVDKSNKLSIYDLIVRA